MTGSASEAGPLVAKRLREQAMVPRVFMPGLVRIRNMLHLSACMHLVCVQ